MLIRRNINISSSTRTPSSGKPRAVQRVRLIILHNVAHSLVLRFARYDAQHGDHHDQQGVQQDVDERGRLGRHEHQQHVEHDDEHVEHADKFQHHHSALLGSRSHVHPREYGRTQVRSRLRICVGWGG